MTIGTPDEFTLFCNGVRSLCEVDLTQYRRGQMERRIRTFAARRGTPDLPAYLSRLRAEHGELEEFLDRVTINVSQLWRNPEQWRVIEQDVLPELATARVVRAWSAGCSYGAEAHTLAAVARDAVPHAQVRIRGTDIDARMVERARAGWFSDADARSAPRAPLERWFELQVDGSWQARDAIRQMCSFDTGDLLRMRVAKASLDLILCRNTVIYFKDDVRDALHARLADALRPGGYLIIGSTERVSEPREMGLVPTHPFTYRKS